MSERHSIFKRIGVVPLLAVMTLCLVLQGCASKGGKTYGSSDVRTAQDVYYGTIKNVGEVTVEDDPSLLGPAIGGVAGGFIGSVFGGGAGRTLFTVGGALAGAALGAATESGVRGYKAAELTVQLDSGRTVVIVQGNDEYFVTGDKVRVLDMGNGDMRVQHW